MPRSLAGLAVLLVSTVPAIAAAGPSAAQLQALETALNGTGELRGAMEDGPGLDVTLVELRRRSVLRQFPDARWQLTTGKPLRDGRSTVQLQVTGTRQEGPTRYRLDAQQQLVLSSSGGPGGRINGQIVIREQTLMRSGEADLPVSLLIPDAVLTGQRYDVDALFDEPLEGAIAAGGLVALTGQQVNALESPELQLGALGGGGLFKSVQAPFTPGSQTWAILLVHPKGIVSATKRVLVVADKTQLDP
ncbi:hypothetical protein KBY72_05885 [Cyanobium sp. BA5m-21]|nr:hypothetical protein [Cyanobium sp. BA5m-10]MCP9906710.1 hypothetical protein [Cyanobium sp. BA5m-21]MCP9914365.1 hypothetical protein [Cyanobium sp. BA20m-14]